MNWEPVAPTESGDLIRTKVSFYYHYGIFVSEDEVIQFGLPTDPGKNSADIKVLVSDIATFLNGGEIETAQPTRQERSTMRPKAQIVETARSKIGTGGYDILHNNCEHFMNECAFCEAKSAFLDDVRAKIRQKLKITK